MSNSTSSTLRPPSDDIQLSDFHTLHSPGISSEHLLSNQDSQHRERDPSITSERPSVPVLPDKNISQAILRWRAQLACWSAGLVFYIIIVVVLRIFNGRGAPTLPYNIQLQAVVSFLGSIGDAFLLATVTAVVGQAKWIRVRARRVLKEFSSIDKASRGAWESMTLLARGGAGLVATTGACITVSMVFTGFFTQQTIKVVIADVPINDTAILPAAVECDTSDHCSSAWMKNRYIFMGLDPRLTQAAFVGMFGPLDQTIDVTAHCGTGNCTWDPFHTLGVCSTCFNLTSQLSSRSVTRTLVNLYDKLVVTTYKVWSLPNGHILDGLSFDFPPQTSESRPDISLDTRAILNVTQERHSWDGRTSNVHSLAFAGDRSVIVDVMAIGLTPYGLPAQGTIENGGWNLTQGAPPVAYECALRWCVKEISANMTNGRLQEMVAQTLPNKAGSSQQGTTLPPPFTASIGLQTMLQEWLASFLPIGFAYTNISRTSLFQSQRPPLDTIAGAMNESIAAFPQLMDNVALSITKALRSMPSQQQYWRNGTTYDTVVRIQVYWAWLTYPFAAIVLTGALLTMVILDTATIGGHPWKQDILAVMYHSFSITSALNSKLTLRSMEASALDHTVQLKESTDGAVQLSLDQVPEDRRSRRKLLVKRSVPVKQHSMSLRED